MKTNLKSFTIFMLLLVLSACKSDYEKYNDVKVEAARSPVTEMETPEGFRFDMDENAVNEKLSSFPQREIDDETLRF